MTTVQQYCLRWNNHQPNFISVFSSLLLNETLVDVTLAAEGRQLQAHKVVLSACSSYFQSLFTTNPCKHPIVILKDVQYNDLKTMVDFMYYGEVNVSTEQLPQILKTAEMLKIKGLAEMPDAASVTKSDSKSSDHTDGNQSISGVESMWGSTESQQQQVQQQQYHTIRRTPSPSNMSPATRRKRLRKTSTGSGSVNISTSIERIQDDQVQHQQQQTIDGRMMQKYSQQQSVDVPLSTFSAVSQTGAIANVRGLKINSSPDNQMQHQQDSHEHIDESQHITEMKTEDLSCVNQSMPLDISTGTSTTPVSCPPTQQHSGGQWAVIDTNYSRFALTTSAGALPTSTVQHSSAAHHHHHHHHHEGNIAAANQGGGGGGGSGQSGGHGNDNMSLGSNHSSSHGSNNSNSNNNATIQSQTSTPVQLQYQTTYSPQIIAVNPNNIVNNYPPSISTPNSPLVQSVYSQQSTPIQSPVNIQNSTNDGNTSASNNNSVNANSSSGSVNAAAPPKRKRSVNPQGEENFLRALDAVRFGGIGFCKETQQSELIFTSCSSPSSPIMSLGLSSPAIITTTTNVLVGSSGSGNNSNINSNTNLSAASKRGRLLIRQQRIKKDGDQTGDLETPEASIYQEYLLSVPSSGAKMERHASEPSPASSGTITSSSNLLSVPTHSSYLIKQHSHPLLPSQSSHRVIESSSSSYTLTRQLSHPIVSHQPSQIVTSVSSHAAQDIAASGQLLQLHQHKSAPVRSQTLPHYTVTDMSDFSVSTGSNEVIKTQQTSSGTSVMSNSPTVVIIPDVSSDQHTTVVQSHHNLYQKSSSTSSHHLQLPSIRVKSEELQRSVSSPSTSTRSDLSFETTTRSSHCPTLRAGPALGCNYCWNTIDAHGRILRRKTKYHCPECQTNLCIVPCFQEYHERQSNEGNSETSSTSATKSSGLKSLKTSQTI